MADIGQVGVDVKPEADEGALEKLDGDLTARFKAIGDKLGGGLKAGLAAGAVGVGGLVAAGAGLYKLGGDFDAVYDGIQTTTGKTGKELDGLKDSFRNVAKTVPVDFDTAGKAIGDLSSKTGLAGKPLDDLATKYLNLSNLIDGDVSKSIEENQKLFADFGLSAADSSKGLDKLFSVSQKTGTDMGTLSATMDKFGPQLRQMGMGFDESAELVGKLSAKGVDVSKVLGGMGLVSASIGKDIQQSWKDVGKASDDLEKTTTKAKDAIAKAEERAAEAAVKGGKESEAAAINLASVKTQAHKDMADAQQRLNMWTQSAKDLEAEAAKGTQLSREKLMDLVQTMKDAESPSLALAAAQTTLGKKVGMEFVDAVRSGKLSAEDFTATLGDSAGAINNTAADTADAAETMKLAMNRAKIAIEPLAEKAFGLAATLAEKVAPAIASVAEWLGEKLPPVVASIEKWISGSLVPALRNMAEWFTEHVVPAIRTAVDYVVTNWPKVQETIGRILDGVKQTIQTVIAVVTQVWESSHDRILAVVDIVWDGIRERIRSVMEIIRGVIQTVTALIHGDWGNVWNGIKQIIDGIWDGIVGSIRLAVRLMGEVVGLALDGLVKAFQALGAQILEALKAFPTLLADTGKRLIQGLADAVGLAWDLHIAFIRSIPKLIADGVGDLWEVLRATGKRLIDGFLDAHKLAFQAVLEFAGDIRRAISDRVGDLWEGIRGTGRRLIEGFIDAVKDAWNGLIGWFGTIRQMIGDKVGDLADGLTGTAKRLIEGFGGAAKDAWNGVGEWLGGIPKAAADKVGDLIGTLKGTGGNLITGLWDAMKEKWTEVVTWFGGLGSTVGTKIKEVAGQIGSMFADALKAPMNAVIGLLKNFQLPSFQFSLPGPMVRAYNILNPLSDLDGGPWTIGGQHPFAGLNLLAKGDIVDRPTLAVFGEAGLEAAAPLGADRVADFRNIVTDRRFLEQMGRAFPGAAAGRSVVLHNYAPPARVLDEAEIVRLIRRSEMLAGV